MFPDTLKGCYLSFALLHAHVPCRCLELGEPERVSLEYAQQLLLGTLLSICNSLCKDGVDDARG